MSTTHPEEIFDMVPDPAWWEPRTRDLWGVSLSFGAHIAAVVLLSFITFNGAEKLQTIITSYLEEEGEDLEQQFKFDTTVVDQVGNDGDVNTMAASQEAATAIGRDPQKEMEDAIEAELATPTVRLEEHIPEPSKAQMLAAVNTTGASEHVGGVEGAVDRLAFEIAAKLRQQKLIVNWIFDVSPSLGPQRKGIAERVETVYRQLDNMAATGDKALKSTVSTFGDKHEILTDQPIDDPAELVKLVRGIRSEAGGTENVFAAVSAVTNKFLSYRTKMHRGMINVIVTDEAGSDLEKLDAAIGLVRRYSIPCYVVGEAAPFGRRTVEQPFTLENGETVIGIMHRGPETLYQERINKMGFWGVNGSDLERMSSGFGPYGLTRLCVESGGLYFITDQGRGPRFDPALMRSYAPDYRVESVVKADVMKNKASSLLIQMAEDTKKEGFDIPTPSTFFEAPSDQRLREELDQAQRPLADLDYKVGNMLRLLEQGEKDAPKIKSPRLKAAYDLEMGRLLAMRSRALGYNAMLAEMKSTPKKFDTAGNNAWRLVSSPNITSGAETKKLANRAREYLHRVVDEHPGTPWAAIASLELSSPLGWDWKEAKYDPAGMGGGRPGRDKPAPKFIEETDPKTGKKSRRQLPDGPVRREI